MATPLSYASLLRQADDNFARYKTEANARDQAFYGPGKMQRTVFNMPEQRLPPQWDAFFQALQNNGVSRMRSFPTHTALGPTNQIGVRSGPAVPPSVAALDDKPGIRVSQRPMGQTNSTAQSKLKVMGQRGGAAYRGQR